MNSWFGGLFFYCSLLGVVLCPSVQHLPGPWHAPHAYSLPSVFALSNQGADRGPLLAKRLLKHSKEAPGYPLLRPKDPILIVEGSAALPKTQQCAWNTLTGPTYRHLRNWGPVFLQSFGEPSIKEQ